MGVVYREISSCVLPGGWLAQRDWLMACTSSNECSIWSKILYLSVCVQCVCLW